MSRDALGEFEHLVLLGILRLGDGAYAPAILEEIERRTGRPPAAGSVYVTLGRRAPKGSTPSRFAPGGDERGGRPRRWVAVAAGGLRRGRASRAALAALWGGLGGLLAGA